ncbi:hypothetical protein AGMMS49992_29280 [Clostridia bacterium]|nr:hypothetical protein AGMMS49992_29280 [Clostridia bacterium]
MYNTVKLVGSIIDTPRLNHEIGGIKVYRFDMDAGDRATVYANEQALPGPLEPGDRLFVSGALRTFHNEAPGVYHVVAKGRVISPATDAEPTSNIVRFTGKLSSLPPLNYEVKEDRANPIPTVMGKLHQTRLDGKLCTIIIKAEGTPARQICGIGVDETIDIVGRLSSGVVIVDSIERRTVQDTPYQAYLPSAVRRPCG